MASPGDRGVDGDVPDAYVAGADNERAVVAGIAHMGWVITSAALVMISVFGAFVLGSDPIVKMFGVRLATAVLVDATVVRLVLVPATMTLLGDANWWLPGWLGRALPDLELHAAPEAARFLATPAGVLAETAGVEPTRVLAAPADPFAGRDADG